ncbi:MAG: zinc carboxypeptidase, partial [Bacteroidota bacterium]
LVSDNIDAEHTEMWPGGRTNHYWFDLNRDWAWLSQVESQQRIKVYNQWMPHVIADLHEMGVNEPYYFAPAAQPYHEYITKWQGDFQHSIGRNHAKYFDKEGWLYFTREIFDLLYPSYGDSYPIFGGGIGMTYEQGGSGRAGKAIEMHNEEILKLSDRIAHHKTTSLSTIEISSLNASNIVSEFEKFYSESKNNPRGDYKAYIIKGTNPKGSLTKLLNLLESHGIEYGTGNVAKSKVGWSFKEGKQQTFSVNKDDIVIPINQARGLFTQVLFEPNTKVVDSVTYDITAWSLPFAFGLEAYGVKDNMSINSILKNQKVASNSIDPAYAYIIEWNALASMQLVADLMKSKVNMRRASAEFTINNKRFSPGAIIITRADNRRNENLNEIINEASRNHPDAIISTVETGYSDNGIDIGSSRNNLLKPINVLTIRGDNVSPYSHGEIWHFFEQQIEYPITIVERTSLPSMDLSKYSHIIFPEGWYRYNEDQIKK